MEFINIGKHEMTAIFPATNVPFHSFIYFLLRSEPFPSKNACHPGLRKQHMLARFWGIKKPFYIVGENVNQYKYGMKICMEIHMESLQKIKIEI